MFCFTRPIRCFSLQDVVPYMNKRLSNCDGKQDGPVYWFHKVVSVSVVTLSRNETTRPVLCRTVGHDVHHSTVVHRRKDAASRDNQQTKAQTRAWRQQSRLWKCFVELMWGWQTKTINYNCRILFYCCSKPASRIPS